MSRWFGICLCAENSIVLAHTFTFTYTYVNTNIHKHTHKYTVTNSKIILLHMVCDETKSLLLSLYERKLCK